MFCQFYKLLGRKVVCDDLSGKFLEGNESLTADIFSARVFPSFWHADEFIRKEKRLESSSSEHAVDGFMNYLKRYFSFNLEFRLEHFTLVCKSNFDFSYYFGTCYIPFVFKVYYNLVNVSPDFEFFHRERDSPFYSLAGIRHFRMFENCVSRKFDHSMVDYLGYNVKMVDDSVILNECPLVKLNYVDFLVLLETAGENALYCVNQTYRKMLEEFPFLFEELLEEGYDGGF